ncbi:MAG: DUF4381 domain-containing protein [Thiolinea sp.]
MNPELPLRDIHLPPDVNGWPPALGWWLLPILLLGLAWLLMRYLRRRKQTQTVHRSVARPALRELDRIEQAYRDDPAALVKALSVLLRRCAISLHGRHGVSGLTGNAWLGFLDQDSRSPVFSERFRRALTELPYRPQADDEAHELAVAVRRWLQEQEARHV